MIERLRIENYKSIEDLSLNLGRVNVFIGENGAGKSNILEAVALAAAAEGDKLDNEFLASRGVRVSNAALMRSAFISDRSDEPISITVQRRDGAEVTYSLTNDNKPYSAWECNTAIFTANETGSIRSDFLQEVLGSVDEEERSRIIEELRQQLDLQLKRASENAQLSGRKRKLQLKLEFSVKSENRIYTHEGMSNFQDFLIYSPENSSLRMFDREGQIEPLGIAGEGLLRFLEVVSSERDKTVIGTIKEALRLFDWFDDFQITKRRSGSQMNIVDQFLDQGTKGFDQRSANEGFLFVAFYVAILSSSLTPRFFAIDNVDTALNPKLCQEVVRRIVGLAKTHGKQLILTTHNPAVLDGLNLNDDEQRLFVISRNSQGKTRARRFERKPSTGQPTRLSELFIRGALGGLPKGF